MNWEDILKVITIPQVDLETNMPEYDDARNCKEKIDRIILNVKNLMNNSKNDKGIKFKHEESDEHGFYYVWHQEYIQDIMTPDEHLSYGREDWKDIIREHGMPSDKEFNFGGEFGILIKQERCDVSMDILPAVKAGMPDDFYCKFYDLLTQKIDPFTTNTVSIEGTKAYITLETKPRDIHESSNEWVWTDPEFNLGYDDDDVNKEFESEQSPYRGFSHFTYSLFIPEELFNEAPDKYLNYQPKSTIFEVRTGNRFITDATELQTILPEQIQFLQHTGAGDSRHIDNEKLESKNLLNRFAKVVEEWG